MNTIDFILDLVALLLWLSWLSVRLDASVKTSAASLAGTLRKAGQRRPRRWIYLAGLVLLLMARGFGYWEICPSLHVNPALNLGIIKLGFRSDDLIRMELFSMLSFGLVLVEFYFWMLLLSVANFRAPKNEPFQKMVRDHLAWLENWPRVLRLLLPFILGAAIWLALHPLFTWLRILPPVRSSAQFLEQAALIGAAAYLSWKYLLAGVFVLHLLNSYVYFGNHSFWNFINLTARNLLYPLHWLPLRAGKVDFLPVAALALVFLAAETFVHLRMPF